MKGTVSIEFSDREACQVGDMFKHFNADIVVTEVLESRPAKGLHKISAIWNMVVGEYQEQYAGTN